jgi:hypothetical protein
VRGFNETSLADEHIRTDLAGHMIHSSSSCHLRSAHRGTWGTWGEIPCMGRWKGGK